jgi:hypothetical protein
MSAADLVRWHWEKAGTIEHVHRSLKDELGAGVLPSQRFGANAAWFRINAIAYNLLTLLKRRALPERCRLARPKQLRFEIFNAPARLSVHQSQLIANLCASSERTGELVLVRQRLLAIRQALGESPAPIRQPPRRAARCLRARAATRPQASPRFFTPARPVSAPLRRRK